MDKILKAIEDVIDFHQQKPAFDYFQHEKVKKQVELSLSDALCKFVDNRIAQAK